MNISRKIGMVLQVGGILMAVSFISSIILRIIGLPQADTFALIGILITASTPVAGVVAAMILLIKNNETKYAFYAVFLLILIVFAGIWRLSN